MGYSFITHDLFHAISMNFKIPGYDNGCNAMVTCGTQLHERKPLGDDVEMMYS